MQSLKILFSSLLMIFITQPFQALAAWEVGNCAPGALGKPAECQFRVPSLTPARSVDDSKGIRLDNGVNHVLFNNYPAIGPRFVSNNGGSDIFIPQATSDEFNSFLEAPTPGVVKKYAVAPRTYTATPSLCPGMTPSSVLVHAPEPVNWPNPVVVAEYVPVVDENTPATTKTTITPSTPLRSGTYLVFTLTRNDCSTDAQSNGPYCVLAKFREQQTLVFSATGTKLSFSWGDPVVTSVNSLSKNNGAYLPVANCNSVAPPINASCGSSNGKTLSSIPATTTLCAYGNPSAISGTGPWTWRCLGVSGGTSVNCSAAYTPAVTGVCGSSNGKTLATAPTAGTLCTTGTPSAVSGTGPWSWSCAGSGGGTTAYCSAQKTPSINGSCGSSNLKTLVSAPAASTLCAAGTASAVSGTGPWTWNCAGLYGGTTAYCSAQKAPPACTPTACKTCNSSGNLVNKTNGVTCIVGGGSWDPKNSKAGWCLNGRCAANFWDNCSGKAGEARCWKSKSAGDRAGISFTKSCSTCKTGGNVDSCSVCTDNWGAGKTGDWDNFYRYFD